MEGVAAKIRGPAERGSAVNQDSDFFLVFSFQGQAPTCLWGCREDLPRHQEKDWTHVPSSYKGTEVTKVQTWKQEPACNDAEEGESN